MGMRSEMGNGRPVFLRVFLRVSGEVAVCNVNWAKAALDTVALVAQPPKNSVLALDFQDGI